MFKKGANDRVFVRILRLGPSIKRPALHELMQKRFSLPFEELYATRCDKT